MTNARKSRSRRLRKKLHLGEFQQLGFDVGLELSGSLSSQQIEQFWDAFIADAIEANHLLYGGGVSGFVMPEGRLSATASHQDVVRAWLQARPEVASVKIGPLADVWYPDWL